MKRIHGDDWRDAWWERLRRGRARSPGRREFENLADMAAQGLPVPRALGWAQRGLGRGRESLVVMEYVENRGDLRRLVEKGVIEPSRAWMERLLELVLRLHGGGWYHRDLYLDHVLLRPLTVSGEQSHSGEQSFMSAGHAARPELTQLCLLDAGRARRQLRPRRRWYEKDLAALLHSTPASVPARLRLRFLSLYLDRRGVHGRRQRRSWAGAIEQRRRRMAAHVPRHGEDPALRRASEADSDS